MQATIDERDPAISSQSSVLVVSTGIPDQDSFSLAATVLNPEGLNRDGTEVEIVARLADVFNNPDPTDNALAPLDQNNADSGELEEFFDFIVGDGFSSNDDKYNGILCSIPAHDGCSSINKSLNVRRSLTLVMSGSTANVCVSSVNDNSGTNIDLIRIDGGAS